MKIKFNKLMMSSVYLDVYLQSVNVIHFHRGHVLTETPITISAEFHEEKCLKM